MSYIDDEEIKIGTDEEEDDVEETEETENGFNNLLDDDLEEDADGLLGDEFKIADGIDL